ncbi:hypothetical protein [Humibacter albus]|uniref:hypothetical protein n=1 Tax=Humibacter albus TaxID=427754 RepID=UPI0003B43DC3|nr:hypothetical protein [Humibacter albus]
MSEHEDRTTATTFGRTVYYQPRCSCGWIAGHAMRARYGDVGAYEVAFAAARRDFRDHESSNSGSEQ